MAEKLFKKSEQVTEAIKKTKTLEELLKEVKKVKEFYIRRGFMLGVVKVSPEILERKIREQYEQRLTGPLRIDTLTGTIAFGNQFGIEDKLKEIIEHDKDEPRVPTPQDAINEANTIEDLCEAINRIYQIPGLKVSSKEVAEHVAGAYYMGKEVDLNTSMARRYFEDYQARFNIIDRLNYLIQKSKNTNSIEKKVYKRAKEANVLASLDIPIFPSDFVQPIGNTLEVRKRKSEKMKEYNEFLEAYLKFLDRNLIRIKKIGEDFSTKKSGADDLETKINNIKKHIEVQLKKLHTYNDIFDFFTTNKVRITDLGTEIKDFLKSADIPPVFSLTSVPIVPVISTAPRTIQEKLTSPNSIYEFCEGIIASESPSKELDKAISNIKADYFSGIKDEIVVNGVQLRPVWYKYLDNKYHIVDRVEDLIQKDIDFEIDVETQKNAGIFSNIEANINSANSIGELVSKLQLLGTLILKKDNPTTFSFHEVVLVLPIIQKIINYSSNKNFYRLDIIPEDYGLRRKVQSLV